MDGLTELLSRNGDSILGSIILLVVVYPIFLLLRRYVQGDLVNRSEYERVLAERDKYLQAWIDARDAHQMMKVAVNELPLPD